MAGAGHQFPGGFPGGAGGVGGGGAGGMRGNFTGGIGVVGGQMQNMNNQLAGVMGGGMPNASSMAGMGSQMVPPYAAAMQGQVPNMVMNQQTIPVASAQQSPGLVGGMGGGGGGGGGGGMPGMGVGGMQQANMNVANMQPGGNMGVAAAPPAPPVAPAPAPAAPQQSKEFNTASLCKFGQETVQDIVNRTQDVFQTLKAIQPPNGTSQGANTSNDRKAKMQEQLRTIRLLFKRLRLIYEKCNENCQVPGMEYTHIESLIPLKEEQEHKSIDERKTLEAYKLACDENIQLTDQVMLKNKQLNEVIKNLRTIIWEINVMLTMRRS